MDSGERMQEELAFLLLRLLHDSALLAVMVACLQGCVLLQLRKKARTMKAQIYLASLDLL